LNSASEFNPLTPLALQSVSKLKKLKLHTIHTPAPSGDLQLRQYREPTLLHRDPNGQVVPVTAPIMPEEVAKVLKKATKVRRIKYRPGDRVEDWKYWKGGSTAVEDYGRKWVNGAHVSLRLRECKRH
jgi:hypothetical protein